MSRIVLATLIALYGAAAFGQNPEVDDTVAIAEEPCMPESESRDLKDDRPALAEEPGNSIAVAEIPARIVHAIYARANGAQVRWSVNGDLAFAATRKIYIVHKDKIVARNKNGSINVNGLDAIKIANHTDLSGSIAWSPDGKYLAIGAWAGNVKVVDRDGKLVFMTKEGVGKKYVFESQYSIKEDPNGKRLSDTEELGWFGNYLVACEMVGEDVLVIQTKGEPKDWKEHMRLDTLRFGPRPLSLKTTEDGRIEEILFMGSHYCMTVFPQQKCDKDRRKFTNRDYMDVSPDGRTSIEQVVAWSSDERIMVTKNGERWLLDIKDSTSRHTRLSPRGDWIVAADLHKPIVRVYDIRDGAVLHEIPTFGQTWVDSTVSPDNKYLAIGHHGGLWVWDLNP